MITCEQIAELIDDTTKVISLSFVESSTGFRYDLEEIGKFCREKNILLCVDGVQGVGVLPIDVKKMNIGFLVCNNYKWMMGYCGTGFAHISRDLLELVKPQGAGWMSDACRYDVTKKQLEYRSDAGRFEMGYPNVAGIYGLSLAAEKYNQLGADSIENYIMELREYLLHHVQSMTDVCPVYDFDGIHRSQIVYLDVNGRCKTLLKDMSIQNVAVEGTYSEEKDRVRLRVAIHYFNNKEDIDKLLKVIERR